MIFAASIWKCLELAFFVFMGVGAVAGATYLYAPMKKFLLKRSKETK